MKLLAYSIALAGILVRVQLCNPGEAWGSHILRNHGLELAIDPTVWSRHRNTHTFALTTGGREPSNCRDNGYKKLLAAIFCDLEDPNSVPQAQRGMVLETNRWMQRWREEARARASARREVRSVW